MPRFLVDYGKGRDEFSGKNRNAVMLEKEIGSGWEDDRNNITSLLFTLIQMVIISVQV